ncbi:hypothetical protein F4678DRAFT_464604 [Xylaria arbuscula]|nr:hypothetical protein F4678DRAFT_464604 [Xylaria arbuscula]
MPEVQIRILSALSPRETTMNDYQFKVLAGILGVVVFFWISASVFFIYSYYKSFKRSEEAALPGFELVDRTVTSPVEGVITVPIDRINTPSIDGTGEPPFPPRYRYDFWRLPSPAYLQSVNIAIAAEEGHSDLELSV